MHIVRDFVVAIGSLVVTVKAIMGLRIIRRYSHGMPGSVANEDGEGEIESSGNSAGPIRSEPAAQDEHASATHEKLAR